VEAPFHGFQEAYGQPEDRFDDSISRTMRTKERWSLVFLKGKMDVGSG
jgi:hypothetical protein